MTVSKTWAPGPAAWRDDLAPLPRAEWSYDRAAHLLTLVALQQAAWQHQTSGFSEFVLLPFIGGIFVIEALSVILQVASYKLRKKRIFKMAPLHHHFELLGWSESKIIVRFWIASLVFALFALTTLKLR